ncbi:MAG: hypothetical protein IJV47_01185 [Candidatus Methanomethylophilaceae archaeon]|nr:hypothetical protein [Candidatus Methanomethylophilaceae archaeon]MBQ7978155.1 hypothetical protein [Candidatus Methanomethylophilaceae archaeon]MBQ9689210.1 hypothetical protein [Candidatus Methanomethylophilaceae archaeon]MBR4202089.1 hypothetical protein [Candidatus Methanomethylophilaceae archaeon]
MAGALKVQLLETFAALITAAFGLVAALAWNETIKDLVALIFPNEDDTIWGNLVYAIIVTILAVIMTYWISKTLSKAKEALAAEEAKE